MRDCSAFCPRELLVNNIELLLDILSRSTLESPPLLMRSGTLTFHRAENDLTHPRPRRREVGQDSFGGHFPARLRCWEALT